VWRIAIWTPSVGRKYRHHSGRFRSYVTTPYQLERLLLASHGTWQTLRCSEDWRSISQHLLCVWRGAVESWWLCFRTFGVTTFATFRGLFRRIGMRPRGWLYCRATHRLLRRPPSVQSSSVIEADCVKKWFLLCFFKSFYVHMASISLSSYNQTGVSCWTCIPMFVTAPITNIKTALQYNNPACLHVSDVIAVVWKWTGETSRYLCKGCSPLVSLVLRCLRFVISWLCRQTPLI
jgi:hypothetical protein